MGQLTQNPPEGFQAQLIWCIDWIRQLRGRLGTGGGGGGSVSLPATQIGYGTGSGITSSANFTYDPTVDLGIFNAILPTTGAAIGLEETSASTWLYQVADNSGTYLSIDQSNNLYQIGDISIVNNGTYLSVDDGNSFTSIYSQGDQLAVFASSSSHEIDVEIGDVGGTGNSTAIEINDADFTVAIQSNDAIIGSFTNKADGIVASIGDVFDSINGTYLSVDDVDFVVTVFSQGGRLAVFTTDGSIAAQIGDVDNNGNGTSLYIDDGNEIIEGLVGGTPNGISLNFAAKLYQFGDFAGLFNSTNLVIDDGNEVVISTNAVATPTMQVWDLGGDIAIENGVRGMYYDPASLQATATITLPATPVRGQEVLLLFGGTHLTGAATPVVTTLTISAAAGQTLMGTYPTSANTSTVLEVKYRDSTSQWYRID